VQRKGHFSLSAGPLEVRRKVPPLRQSSHPLSAGPMEVRRKVPPLRQSSHPLSASPLDVREANRREGEQSSLSPFLPNPAYFPMGRFRN